MNYEKLRGLVPSYVNGTISKKDKEILEKFAKTDPKLQREIDEFSKIEQIYNLLEVPEPPDYMYDEIMENIKEPIQSQTRQKSCFLDVLKRFVKLPVVPWGIVFAELAVIAFLIFSSPYSIKQFTTASSAYQKERCRLKVDVVFKEKTTIGQINTLLDNVDGYIDRGPSPDGAYSVCILHNQPYSRVFNKFISSGYVKIVTKSY
jgi:hypothetical protein